MDSFYEFMSAALPWISMGLLLAVLCSRGASRKNNQEKRENYGSEGMALGMCFGVAMATALHFDTGPGLTAGMLLGLIVGSGFEKKNDRHEGGTTEWTGQLKAPCKGGQ